MLGSNLFGQCDTIRVTYQIDHLVTESSDDEQYFSRIPEDSLQINFNDGFDSVPIIIRIDGKEKHINSKTDRSLSYTGSARFIRPGPDAKIELVVHGTTTWISYNSKYNMIHVWYDQCHLTVRHTNRMMIYE